jgi:predicted RecA/RadA family phage recombinase
MATNMLRRKDGRSVDVTVTSSVVTGDLAFVENWLGVVPRDADSGESIALNIENCEYDMILPTALNLSKGDEVHVTITDLTGHIPDDSAYEAASATDTRYLGRCTTDQNGTTGQVRIQVALQHQEHEV